MKVDISLFLADWHLLRDEIPKAIIDGFAKTAQTARDVMRARTRILFKLHSDYITNGILSIPSRDWKSRGKTTGEEIGNRQFSAALKGLTGRHRNFQAAVFLRGSNNPKKSLAFMVVHETGGDKKAFIGALALPRSGVTRRAFRTGKGAVKRSYKPSVLLKHWKSQKPHGGMVGRKWGVRKAPTAFVMESKFGGQIVARRRFKTKRTPLDILYKFQKSAKITRRWRFEETVVSVAKANIQKDVLHFVNKVK